MMKTNLMRMIKWLFQKFCIPKTESIKMNPNETYSISCVKQGDKYGISLKIGNRLNGLGSMLCNFDGLNFLFPTNPNQYWSDMKSVSDIPTKFGYLTDSQMLC